MSESSMIERVRPRETQWLLVGLTLGIGILDSYTSLWWLFSRWARWSPSGYSTPSSTGRRCLMASDTVKGLLVTGEGEGVRQFWAPHAMVLNHIDGENRTWHFALWDDPPVLDAVVESARQAGVSIQRIIGAGKDERYQTLYEAPGAGLWPSAGADKNTREVDES